MDLVTSIGKYLRRHWHTAILWAGIAVCFAVVFYLYDLPLEAVLYAALLSATLLAGSAAAGFFCTIVSTGDFRSWSSGLWWKGQSAGTQEPDR